MDEDIDFTDDEIREELSKLGYYDIAPSRLHQFKKDLEHLVRYDRSKNTSQNQSSILSSGDGSGIKTHSPNLRVPLEETTVPHTKPSGTHIIIHGKENVNLDPKDVYVNARSRGVALGSHGDGLMDRRNFVNVPQMNESVSESDSERRFIRRKTLRKADDGSKVIDESISDVGSLASLEERLKEVRLYDLPQSRVVRRPCSASTQEAPYRLDPDDPRPSSVILCTAEHPHTRNLKKCDPVNRFLQFRQSWSNHQVPGEKNHKRLRWNVREQMLYQDIPEFKRPQKKFVPNSYVVPTDKKRSALRWQVRTDIAQGNIPTPEY